MAIKVTGKEKLAIRLSLEDSTNQISASKLLGRIEKDEAIQRLLDVRLWWYNVPEGTLVAMTKPRVEAIKRIIDYMSRDTRAMVEDEIAIVRAMLDELEAKTDATNN